MSFNRRPFPGCKTATQVVSELHDKYGSAFSLAFNDPRIFVVMMFQYRYRSPLILQHRGSRDPDDVYLTPELEKWWHDEIEHLVAMRVVKALQENDG